MTTIEPTLDLGSLRHRFRGAILTADDADPTAWLAATQAYNTTFIQQPRLAAVPADADDVVTIVNFARENGLQVAPQRTGHNAEPLGDLSDLILVKTDALQEVTFDVDRRIARVASGSKWGDVVPEASDLGFAMLHGSTPDVSVAGYSLGGGVGWYARKLGLSTNSVAAIEVVTPDGRKRWVDHDNDPELFWALRGGGGNFGIVTALEVRMYPLAEVYAGVLFFPWERAAEVLHSWHGWTRTVPDEVTSVGRILQFPPLPGLPDLLRGRQFVVVEAVVMGTQQEGEMLLKPLRALGAEIDTFAMVPPQGIAELHMDPPMPVPYTGDGMMLDDLDISAVERFVELTGPDSGSQLVSAEIRHIGGVLRRSRPGHGALATLDAEYMTFGVGMVMGEADHPIHRERLQLLEEGLAQWASARQYLNFTESPTDPARFYPEETYARLRELRAEIDPHEVMRANHPIPPAG